jgi:uncharacterized protein with HEPN domain
MKKDYTIYLKDIIENSNDAKEFTKNITFDEFKNNKEKINAVTKSLENIGEATSNIPDEIKEKYPKINWKNIKDFRNVLIHKYRDIKLEKEWDIIENKLDDLKEQIEEVLEKEEVIN